MGVGYCYGCMEQITEYPCRNCGYFPRNATVSYALQPGTILKGKYLIGKVLGQGGFGITYLGMDLTLQRKVAIKEYYPSGFVSRKSGTSNVIWYSSEAAQSAKQSGQEIVLKEAQKMSKVSDIPSVVKVFNVFQENGTAYICMDYIQGQTLQDKLKKTGPLSWEAAKALFLPVIQAMEHVHQMGLIHRDLSPDNLMIQPDGSIKILDLGAAKDLNRNSGQSSLQVAKNGFSPLEQYMQSGISGSWTDVYAMAATMYYALTGILPPSALDRANNDLMRWDLPQLRELPPEVSRALQHAMTVRSGSRTQTMFLFSQELLNKGNRPKPLNKWIIAAAAATVVLGAVVVGLTLNQNPATSISSGLPKSSTLTPAPSADTLNSRINELMASCSMETFDYRNGSQMEFYFDSKDNERLRIFINEDGKDEFTFLAEYDDEGNVLEKYGFQGQTLDHYILWQRNEDGKATQRLEYKGDHELVEKIEYHYDSEGREISRTGTDQNGKTTFYGKSTYDSAGQETRSGIDEDGNNYIYVYSADGNMIEMTRTKPNGAHITHAVYRYDKNGNETEDIGYDENGQEDYRRIYHYDGDLQTGYTWYYYYNDNVSTTEYAYIFGPRNIQIGEQSLDVKYGSDSERVRDMFDDWQVRSFTYSHSAYSAAYTVHYYDWGISLGYDGFDVGGNLVTKSTELFDETGKNTGRESVMYNDDGGYSISRYSENSELLYDQDYDSSGTLVSETTHIYTDGVKTGSVETAYNEDGSYVQTESDASYHDTVSKSYDSLGTLLSMVEYNYNADGTRAGSVSTIYHNDGSYTVTVMEGYYDVVSQKTYDANGNQIEP